MEVEVEYLNSTIKCLPLLTLWGESWWMEEDAEKQYVGNRRSSISILQLSNLHIILHVPNLIVAGKCILICIEYSLLCKLIIYVLYSLTCSVSTFYLGLIFTHTVAWVNMLSMHHPAHWLAIRSHWFGLPSQIRMMFDILYYSLIVGSWSSIPCQLWLHIRTESLVIWSTD